MLSYNSDRVQSCRPINSKKTFRKLLRSITSSERARGQAFIQLDLVITFINRVTTDFHITERRC